MLRIGCAKVDTTPDHPVYLRGYGARNALSNGIEERIHAGLMILEQEGQKVLLVTLDMIGINAETAQKVYKALEAETGFGEGNTYLCGSHSHFAPGLNKYRVSVPGGELPPGDYPADEAYCSFFIAQLVAGVREAQKNVEDVEVEEVEIPLPELLMNRRPIMKGTNKVETNYVYPLPPEDEKYDFQPVDPNLMVWRFRTSRGLKAILGRFSCHPVTGGYNFYGVSGDYPGYFQQYVSELFGCPAFFMLGSAGDAVPMQRENESRKDIGHIMAYAIRLAERRFRKAPEFSLDYKLIKLHVTPRTDVEPVNPNTVLPMRFLHLGSKILVGMPFEVLTEIGLELRKACPNAILTSITGGYDGYLPLAKHQEQGGYEVEDGTEFIIGTGDAFLKTAINELNN